jgi:hypothetical protein
MACMPKETAISMRIGKSFKAELEKIAASEGRSVSQVCEALLAGGMELYKREGSSYLQRFIVRKRAWTGKNPPKSN